MTKLISQFLIKTSIQKKTRLSYEDLFINLNSYTHNNLNEDIIHINYKNNRPIDSDQKCMKSKI